MLKLGWWAVKAEPTPGCGRCHWPSKSNKWPPHDIIEIFQNVDVLACKAKRKRLVFLISGEFADRAETLVRVNLTFISESQFCYALGLWFYIMFTWTSSVFLRPPRGWLALLLTTVCPAPPLFSKDLKVFHHRPRHCFHSDSPALSRQAGRLSRGGKFVSSGNTVFSLSLLLSEINKDAEIDVESDVTFFMFSFVCVLPAVWYWIAASDRQSYSHAYNQETVCMPFFFFFLETGPISCSGQLNPTHKC